MFDRDDRRGDIVTAVIISGLCGLVNTLIDGVAHYVKEKRDEKRTREQEERDKAEAEEMEMSAQWMLVKVPIVREDTEDGTIDEPSDLPDNGRSQRRRTRKVRQRAVPDSSEQVD